MRHFLTIFCLITAVLLAAGANADERLKQERELAAVREKIQALQQQIRTDQGKQNEVEKKLREVETKLGNVQRSLNQLNSQIKSNQKRLSALQGERRKLQSKLKEQRSLLIKQLRSAYVGGQREQIKLILNQEDPAELSRLSTYYDYINKARTEQIKATQSTMRELLTVGEKIQEQNLSLVALKEKQETQRRTLDKNRSARQIVLDRIREQLAQEGQELGKLKRDKQEIERLITSLTKLLSDIPDTPTTHVPFAQLKGKLRWPTRGTVKNQFGASRKVGDLKWQGLMLSAPAGRDVKAVASGRVAFADWLQGFGLLVIVDHDDGYLSLYGHNQVLFAEAGDWIAKDDIISQVGDSGGLDKTALYFELRHQGKPVNPQKWCVKRTS